MSEISQPTEVLHAGKSLEWWKNALINAQLSDLTFDEGDVQHLIDTVYEMTGVKAHPHDSKVYRLAYDIANYED